jgi:hypothetical protein
MLVLQFLDFLPLKPMCGHHPKTAYLMLRTNQFPYPKDKNKV